MATKTKTSKAHMALTFTIGLVFIALVVWFIVSLIGGIVNIFHAGNLYSEGVTAGDISAASALSDQLASVEPDSEAYFEILLSNIVMQDMPAFKKIDDLDSQYLISYGLWQTITLNNSQGILSIGEDGQQYRVPKALVEKMARYYMPFSKKLEHQEVILCGEFAYNRFNGTYTVPNSYPANYLVPKVVAIKQNTEMALVEVTVDCYTTDGSMEDPAADEDNFRKRVVYTLARTKNTETADIAVETEHYTVVSMMQADKEE